MEPKTWSIVADKLGGHWHATVRRGVEGSRGKLGDLVFDLSDADDFRDRVTHVADLVMVRAITRTFIELDKDHLLYPMEPETRMTMSVHIGESMRTELHELVLAQMAYAFGLRLDFAKVGPVAPQPQPEIPGTWDAREIVLAENVGNTSGGPGRYLVTLICGHKKYVAEKRSHYECKECKPR